MCRISVEKSTSHGSFVGSILFFLAAGEQGEGRFENSFGSSAISEVLFIFRSTGRIETPESLGVMSEVLLFDMDV